MYINLDLFCKSGLTPEELLALVGIKQKRDEFYHEGHLQVFENLGLVDFIKGKSTQSKMEKVRLSKKGSDLLFKLSYSSSTDDESEAIKNWIISVYKNKSGGIVKNKTELGRRIQWFKDTTAISGNFLAILIQCFFNDTYDPSSGLTVAEFMNNNPRGVLSNLADNICFSPESHFDKHYTLGKSPLFRYFEENEEYIKRVWESKLDEEGNRK